MSDNDREVRELAHLHHRQAHVLSYDCIRNPDYTLRANLGDFHDVICLVFHGVSIPELHRLIRLRLGLL